RSGLQLPASHRRPEFRYRGQLAADADLSFDLQDKRIGVGIRSNRKRLIEVPGPSFRVVAGLYEPTLTRRNRVARPVGCGTPARRLDGQNPNGAFANVSELEGIGYRASVLVDITEVVNNFLKLERPGLLSKRRGCKKKGQSDRLRNGKNDSHPCKVNQVFIVAGRNFERGFHIPKNAVPQPLKGAHAHRTIFTNIHFQTSQTGLQYMRVGSPLGLYLRHDKNTYGYTKQRTTTPWQLAGGYHSGHQTEPATRQRVPFLHCRPSLAHDDQRSGGQGRQRAGGCSCVAWVWVRYREQLFLSAVANSRRM